MCVRVVVIWMSVGLRVDVCACLCDMDERKGVCVYVWF